MKSSDETNRNIKILNRELSKLNSYGYQFLISVVRGVGTVIGATIVVGLIAAILSNVLKYTGLYPLFSQFFNGFGR